MLTFNTDLWIAGYMLSAIRSDFRVKCLVLREAYQDSKMKTCFVSMRFYESFTGQKFSTLLINVNQF